MVVTRVVKTPGGQKIKVGVIKDRIEVTRPKGYRVYVKAYDERIRDYLKAWILEDLTNGEDFILKATGPRRKGKSTISCDLGRGLDLDMSVDNVVYTAKEFGRLADNLDPSEPPDDLSIILWDEAGYGMFKQRWYEREQQEIVRLLEVNAAKRLVVFLVSPHNDFLNSALQSPTMCKAWVDVGISQQYGKGWATLWNGRYHMFRVAGFWNPLCAFKFQAMTDQFWKDYEVKKFQFIRAAGKLVSKERDQSTRLERILAKLEHEIDR
jgi:hypothetical protein